MAIALDAMGGDLAPAATVGGALRAHLEGGLYVVRYPARPLGGEAARRRGRQWRGRRQGHLPDRGRGLAKADERGPLQGYMESRDVFAGEVDVVATDGFTGNVLLETAEGAVWAFGQLLERQIKASPIASAGALLLGSAEAFPGRAIEDDLVEAAQRAAGLFEKSAA